MYQLVGKLWEPICTAFGKPRFNRDIVTIQVAQPAEPLPECLSPGLAGGQAQKAQRVDSRRSRLLRQPHAPCHQGEAGGARALHELPTAQVVPHQPSHPMEPRPNSPLLSLPARPLSNPHARSVSVGIRPAARYGLGLPPILALRLFW